MSFSPSFPLFGIILLFENPVIALNVSSIYGIFMKCMTVTPMFTFYIELLENCCVHAQDRYGAQPPTYLMVTGA